MAVGEAAATAEALVPRFQFQRLLNQDQAGRRISLLGTIDSKPALLLAERAPFSTDSSHLSSFAGSLANIKNLGANDIYFWFLASSGSFSSPSSTPLSSSSPSLSSPSSSSQPPDFKINLIYPCTEKHIKKYSGQGLRMVTETPEIYRNHVKPYMQRQRDEGRLNWVFNILEGRAEQEDVMYREHGEEGFVVTPDLNWDKKTLDGLHVLGIVERRDIWSVRDLTKGHMQWLKHMREKFLDATVKLYPEIERNQLKLYVHYHPTYYHFHVHIVHVMLEAGRTQAVGKAFGLENIISQLEVIEDGKSMADLSLTYHIGEASETWTEIFQPLIEKGEL